MKTPLLWYYENILFTVCVALMSAVRMSIKGKKKKAVLKLIILAAQLGLNYI